MDPWWNVAVENQAADRVHRIGQEKKVNIYRLICLNTIEERVMEIQQEKMAIINYFVENNNDSPIGKMTIDLLNEIFSKKRIKE
jgi:SNF2 family DNA or RNA helicase